MSSVVADTHAAVWYLAEPERLSKPAKEAMHRAARQGRPIYISPISIVELVYLVEKSRLTEAVHERVRQALRDPASVLRLAPMDLLS